MTTALFFTKNSRASSDMCEQMRYHFAKSIFGFSTILCVSDELLCAFGAFLQVVFLIGSMTLWLLQSKKTVSKTFTFGCS